MINFNSLGAFTGRFVVPGKVVTQIAEEQRKQLEEWHARNAEYVREMNEKSLKKED